MGGYGFFRDVHAATLKPKLLRGILTEKVLDPKRPFGKPSELVEKFKPLVDLLVVHRLLSESISESADSDVVDSYRGAVDDWADRILKLLASDMSDKSLAGVWLLGLTCRECSNNRFLASYVTWFNELLVLIQSSATSERVKLASCASMSDLLTRLAGIQSVKDGAIHAGKVIQTIVKLLNDDDAMAVWETATHLLSTIIHYFPSSVLRHYDSVESVVMSRMLTVNSSAKLLEKLACCLALLPKTRGDEDLMLKRVLVSINLLLDDALEGLDGGESKRQEVFSVLLPPGSSLPPLGEVSNKKANRSRTLLMRIISTLMQCICMMLSGLYPVQVTVPVNSILATIKRVLMVDGSVHPSLEPITTPMQQEDVCAQLPVLHQYSLEVLTAVVSGIDSQLLPYAADIAQLLIWYLKKYTFPETRVQVYSIIKSLLVSMGAGMTMYLAEEVFMSSSIDLNPNDSLGRGSSKVTALASGEPALQRCNKKRKHGNGTMLSEAEQNPNNLEVEVTKDCSKLIVVKIAALQALEALLRAGGALRTGDLNTDEWRTKIDDLVFTTAMNACKRGWAYQEKLEESKTWTGFQLAALDALLASFLAPARVRPSHLPIGLKLFRDGLQLGGPKIAQTCARALLFLEPLLHPRSLPLSDFSSQKTNYLNLIGKTRVSTESDALNLKPSLSDTNSDHLHDIYMERDEDLQEPLPKSHRTQNVDENIISRRASETIGTGDKMMVDSEANGELPLSEKHVDPVSRQGVTVFPPVSGSSAAETESGKAVSKDNALADLPDRGARTKSSEGKDMVTKRADGDKMKLSKDDPDYGSDWSLSTVELDQDSDDEVDSALD